MLNFFTKALIKRQLKGVPEAELNKIFDMIEKNPAFFQTMAANIQAKMKAGKSQEEAMREIMAEGGEDLKKLRL